MATRNSAFTATFLAWDTSANAPKTGDSANITPRILKDGTSAALGTATVTEVDATNFPGLYKVSVSQAESNFAQVVVGGSSSTANIEIIPTTYQMERLPDAAPAANGGLPTVDASNYVAGVQGTLNTLDALDTAQDTQHSTTQGKVDTAQADLNILTGADGATLATAQALYAPAKAGDAMALTSGERTTLAGVIWDSLTSGMVTVGSIGKKLADWTIHSAADVWTSGTRTLTANDNLNDPTAAAIADAVWDEPVAGHVSAGTFGKTDADILADTNELQADWTNGGRLDLLVDQIITNIAALNDVSTAQVATEIADALRTDTGSEVASPPAATAPIAAQIQYLFQALRNGGTQTASARTIRNDAGSTVGTQTVSDDGTTLTVGKAT